MFNWLDPYSQFVGGSLLVDVLLVLSLFVVFQCGVLSLASRSFRDKLILLVFSLVIGYVRCGLAYYPRQRLGA